MVLNTPLFFAVNIEPESISLKGIEDNNQEVKIKPTQEESVLKISALGQVYKYVVVATYGRLCIKRYLSNFIFALIIDSKAEGNTFWFQPWKKETFKWSFLHIAYFEKKKLEIC